METQESNKPKNWPFAGPDRATMTREQAAEMASLIREKGNFSRVETEQFGGEFASPDAPWRVLIWSVNAAAGNRNLTVVEHYAPHLIASIARKAKGRATKRDQEAFARAAAEENDD